MSKVVIYSVHRIKGLEGRYISPIFFNAKQLNGIEKVYTDNENITEVAKKMGIAVEAITKKPEQEESEEAKELKKLKLDELKAKAKELGIEDVDGLNKKDDVIALILSKKG